MIEKIVQANLQRSRHLLRSYHKYMQCEDANIDLHTSRVILAILAESMADKPDTSPQQYEMLDKCGGLICKGIASALEMLKTYPDESGRLAYVVLAEQYLHVDGPAVSINQLQKRLVQVETELCCDEIRAFLAVGEQMAAALLFENKVLSAAIMAQLSLPNDCEND